MEATAGKQSGFASKSMDLGLVEPGKEYPMVFRYEGEQNITNVVPKCGCTSASWDTKTVTLVYMGGRIDSMDVQQGINRQPGSRAATVYFDQGDAEVLVFHYVSQP